MLSPRPAAGLVAALALLLCGCRGPVQVQSHHGGRMVFSIIAVAPLQIAPQLLQRDTGPAAEIVAHQLAEALSRRGVQVVAPSDVARAFAQWSAAGAADTAESPPQTAPPPGDAARLLAEEFAAAAVLQGVLTRWEERQGSEAGALRAAAVGFDVVLRSTPGGKKLWSGNFDHRQKSLGQNVLVAARYPGAGTRWLSAPELAHWGADEVVRRIPLH